MTIAIEKFNIYTHTHTHIYIYILHESRNFVSTASRIEAI